MPIPLVCDCGKQLRVKDDLRGKRIKCPGCAKVIQVPPEAQPEQTARDVVPASPAGIGAIKARRPSPPAENEVKDRPEAEENAPTTERSDGADSPTPFWSRSDDLLALSDEALYLASLDEKKMRKAQSALRQGESAEEVLEEASKVIPFDIMKKVESNLHDEFIQVWWRVPDASEDEDKMIQCADKASRDEIMKVLRQRLGPDWKREVIAYSRLRASLQPLLIIAVFGFLTYCFYMAGAHPESDKSGSGPKTIRTNFIGLIFVWVYNLLGPIPIVILGGLFVAIGVAWLVARLIKPPIMLTLTPAPEPPRRKKRT